MYRLEMKVRCRDVRQMETGQYEGDEQQLWGEKVADRDESVRIPIPILGTEYESLQGSVNYFEILYLSWNAWASRVGHFEDFQQHGMNQEDGFSERKGSDRW